MKDDCHVFIRSVGERTEQLCKALICAQGVLDQQITVVKETPFSEALRKTYELGLQSGCKWSFCVDADILLKSDSVDQMLQYAERQPSNVCEIKGFIIDKFYGGPRYGGIHLYRSSILERALSKIPREGVAVRPETFVLENLKSDGYPYAIVPCMTGVHDFQQYYYDIYRKCFVHAHKHVHHTELFVNIWRAGSVLDEDYRVALQGYADGLAHSSNVYIDATDSVYRNGFERMGLKEKGILPESSTNLSDLDRLVADWKEPEAYRKAFPKKFGYFVGSEKKVSLWEKICVRVNDLGAWRLFPFCLGWLFHVLGESLQMWSIRKR